MGDRRRRFARWGAMFVAALGTIPPFVAVARPSADKSMGNGLTFRVGFDASVRAEPATGRLVVYLINGEAKQGSRRTPADGPSFENPQPMYGMDVTELAPGEFVTVGDAASAFPVVPSALPPGSYQAQAVLDLFHLNSQWKREPGNLHSDVASFTVAGDGPAPPVEIRLTHRVEERPDPEQAGAEVFKIRSALLSEFRGRDVFLRATVVSPIDQDPARAYPAVYWIPGYGGDHRQAFRTAAFLAGLPADSPAGVLARNVYGITLDPEGPNGHHLFADSANNGPIGKALVSEFLPALERKYKLIPQSSARLLRGHSSGGWSVLWLATTYPETFGACWSSSPDPVDFRRLQRSDIYGDGNIYADAKTGRDIPSYRAEGDGAVRMTVRQENEMEEVLGPNNSSAQQWDSWFAVFGARTGDRRPAALFDAATGVIDHAVAETYRAYDIRARLERDPQRFGPIFRRNIRLFVGDQDNFYLNEAVELLKQTLDGLAIPPDAEHDFGYVKLVPGTDHGSVLRSPQSMAIPQEMLEHLRRFGHVPK